MGYSIMGMFNRHRTATRHVDWKGVICSDVQIGTSVGAYRLPSVWMVVSFRTRQMGRSWKLYSGCNLQQILQMTTGRPPVNMDHQRILGLNTCREGGVLNPWRTKLQGSMFSPSSSARTGLGPCRFGVIVSHTATPFFFILDGSCGFMWVVQEGRRTICSELLLHLGRFLSTIFTEPKLRWLGDCRHVPVGWKWLLSNRLFFFGAADLFIPAGIPPVSNRSIQVNVHGFLPLELANLIQLDTTDPASKWRVMASHGQSIESTWVPWQIFPGGSAFKLHWMANPLEFSIRS